MKEFLVYIYPFIEKIVEISATLAKFSLGLGVVLITWYFINIRYFPTDMELGDGLLFIMLTFKFMMLVVGFLFAHYALGKIVQKFIVFLKNIIFSIKAPRQSLNSLKSKINLESIKEFSDNFIIKFGVGILFVFAILILFYFYEDLLNNSLMNILINLVFLTFSCVFVLTTVDSVFKDFKENSDNSSNKKILIKLGILFILTFFYILYYQSNSESKFLKFSSSLVREENNNKSVVYVKKDYIDFFEKKRPDEARGDYIPVDGVEVVLRGVGKNVLLRQKIQINNKIEVQKVEIPNDSILIVRKD